jgi:hypothetical protein
MKATVKTEAQFNPVTLNITFESKEEIGKFYAIMNHCCITEAAEFGSNSDAIRLAIRQGYTDPIPDESFHEKINDAICWK